MKRLLSWLIISPILLFLIWLAGISDDKFRNDFMDTIYVLFKKLKAECEREQERDNNDRHIENARYI